MGLEEDRVNLELGSFGQFLHSHSRPRREVTLEVVLVDVIDLREVVHIREIQSILDGVLLEVKATVCCEILQVIECLLSLSLEALD